MIKKVRNTNSTTAHSLPSRVSKRALTTRWREGSFKPVHPRDYSGNEEKNHRQNDKEPQGQALHERITPYDTKPTECPIKYKECIPNRT
jgi:hypothetical protein